MNARQKAKKYKRLYEALLNQPVQSKVEQHKIDTVRVERFYPEHIIIQENSSYLREVIVMDIAEGLARSLDKYVDYKSEFCPRINKYRFCGEIKVVDRLCAENESKRYMELAKSYVQGLRAGLAESENK